MSPDLQDMLQQGNECSLPLATPIGLPRAWVRRAAGPAGRRLLPAAAARAHVEPAGPAAGPGAGEAATVASPELAPSQRTATVTLGTTAGDVVVTLSEEDARYRRFSRTACLLVAGRLARQDLLCSGILAPNAKALIDAGNFLALSAVGKYLMACLTLVDDSLVGSARPVALPASGQATGRGLAPRPPGRAPSAGCRFACRPARPRACCTSTPSARARRHPRCA